ncbi:MAG: DUF3530 family protein [Oceanospirillales bacterium]|nr:MAG: DUF3530 family protein [Oceanospirillales bacterium]
MQNILRQVIGWLVILMMSFSTSANTRLEAELRRAVPIDTNILILEESQGQFPALFQPAVRAEPLGAILLLTDTQSQQQWLDQSHAIRIHLADHGWQTMTLPLPVTPVKTDLHSDEVYAELVNQHQLQVISRIQTGLQQLDEERILILAMGRSAEWAARVMQDSDPSIRLIIVNPRPADDQQPMRLLEYLTALEVTIIDLYREPYTAGKKAIPDARLRRNAMVQAGHSDYHQQIIKDAVWGTETDWLKRQLRGVINTYIINADQKREQQAPEALEVDQRPPGVRR